MLSLSPREAWRGRRDAIDDAIDLLPNGLAIVGDNVRLYGALGHAYSQYRDAAIDLSDRPLDEAEGAHSESWRWKRVPHRDFGCAV